MKKQIAFSLIVFFLIAGCQPSETAIQTALAQTQAALPTATLFPPTNTLQPTNTTQPTSTPTITPTQIPLEFFGALDFVESLRSNPASYNGTLIKAIAYYLDFPGTEADYSLISADVNSPLGIKVAVVDQLSDQTSKQLLKGNEWIWIYGKIIEPEGDSPKVVVYYVESIPKLIQPKSSGVFKVGVDIAPGTWKSMSDATVTQECYWARSDKNGNIIENYFGYGGTTIYIAETDYAFENKACGTLVYLGT